MTLFLAGDSHTTALLQGLRLMSPAERNALGRAFVITMTMLGHYSLSRFFECRSDRLTLSDPQGRAALEYFTGRPYLSPADRGTVFGFSFGLMTTALVRMEMWRRFVPWSLEREGDQQLLSDGAIEAIALKHNEHVIEFFARITEFGICCFSIAAPPLCANEKALADGFRSDVLLEVDRIARHAVARILERSGVKVVWPPDEAYEGQPGRSFLRPSLAVAGDTHHANAIYGRMMIEHVVKETAELRPWLLLPPLKIWAQPGA